VGGWFRQHRLALAAGAVGLGVGFALGAGTANIGDGTVQWGTIGEWVGGLGAAGAVLWAVSSFRRERAAIDRRFAELVAILPPDWARVEDGRLRVHVAVLNNGPAPIDHVEVQGELDGIRAFAEELENTDWQTVDQGMRVGPGQRKGYLLSWTAPADGAVPDPERLTVFFRDIALNWWSRALDEPPKPDEPSRPRRAPTEGAGNAWRW
jgi:hypothetical protein